MERKNLVGERFGRLIVLEPADDYITPKGQHKPAWLCQCDCGNKTIATGTNLKSGHTLSCGCLGLEKRAESRRRRNQYENHSEYVVGYTANGDAFRFNAVDYNLVSSYSWYKTLNGYIATRNSRNEMLLLHQLIMGTTGDGGYLSVDHINHDKTDNRRCNLRYSNKILNGQNTKIRADNSSGATGVYWSKRWRVWFARITVNKRTIHLGTFNTFEEAVAARKAAEERYFGEFSYDNSMAAVPTIAV